MDMDWSHSESSDDDSDTESNTESDTDNEDCYLYSLNPNMTPSEIQRLMMETDSDSDGEEGSCIDGEINWVQDGTFTPLNCESTDIKTTFHLPLISSDSTPLEIFSKFVPIEELERVCIESARYVEQEKQSALEKGKPIPFSNFAPFNTVELYRFLALKIATGIIKKPSIKDYWSTKGLHNSPFFQNTMSRNRFEEIKRSLHFCNNQNSDFSLNRMLKLGSLPNYMMQEFAKCIVPGRHLCIDESLAKFKGRLSFKQYIPNKRARFGVKLFVLADCDTKFIINIIPYQGHLIVRFCLKLGETTSFLHSDTKDELGYGGAIVRSLMDPYLNTHRIVFIDNYFNSPKLVQQLGVSNTGVVGTVRLNRKSMPKFSSKLKKGDVEAFTSGGLLVERWMDRREVLMLNNCIRHDMVANSKLKIKPQSVLAYNSCMGAVDELDKSLQPYFAERKCVKWYQKIWLRYIYIAAVNSLRVMNSFKTSKKVAFKDFLEDLIQELLDSNPIEKSTRGRPTLAPSAETRLHGHDHFPHKVVKLNPVTNKNKPEYLGCVLCRGNGVRHETSYECTKCNVRLCVGITGRPCFEQYHSMRKVPCKKRSYSRSN